MVRLLLFCFICTFLFGGCTEKEYGFGDNFVSAYGPVNEISLLQGFVHLGEDSLLIWEYNDENLYSVAPRKYLSVNNVPLSYSEYFNLIVCSYGSRMTNWTYLRELLEPIGDTSYENGKFETYIDNAIAFYDTLSTINVICTNADFDAQHPQGSSLNDILTIYVRDWGNVIRNGYQVPKAEGYYAFHDNFYKYPDCFYVESLSTFNWEAHTYMKSEFILGFNKAPQQSGEYTFEVTLRAKDGKEAKATLVKATFDN